MNDIEQIRQMIINSSVSGSAIRNQGKGIAEPIREKLKNEFVLDEFFKNLKSKNKELNRIYRRID